jgi:hypothetical protein
VEVLEVWEARGKVAEVTGLLEEWLVASMEQRKMWIVHSRLACSHTRISRQSSEKHPINVK